MSETSAGDTPKTAPEKPASTFTHVVTVPKEHPLTGAPVLDETGKPAVARTLGPFTFKVPTIRSRINIGTRRTLYLAGHNPNTLDPETVLLAECVATIPYVVVDAPHGWPRTVEDWEKWTDQTLVTEDRSLYALYNAFQEGVRTFRGERAESPPP